MCCKVKTFFSGILRDSTTSSVVSVYLKKSIQWQGFLYLHKRQTFPTRCTWFNFVFWTWSNYWYKNKSIVKQWLKHCHSPSTADQTGSLL